MTERKVPITETVELIRNSLQESYDVRIEILPTGKVHFRFLENERVRLTTDAIGDHFVISGFIPPSSSNLAACAMAMKRAAECMEALGLKPSDNLP